MWQPSLLLSLCTCLTDFLGFKQLALDPAFRMKLFGNFVQDAPAPNTSERCKDNFFATRCMWKKNGSNEEFLCLPKHPQLLGSIRKFLSLLDYQEKDISMFKYNERRYLSFIADALKTIKYLKVYRRCEKIVGAITKIYQVCLMEQFNLMYNLQGASKMDKNDGMYVSCIFDDKDKRKTYFQIHYFLVIPMNTIRERRRKILFCFGYQMLPCQQQGVDDKAVARPKEKTLAIQLQELFKSKHESIVIEFPTFCRSQNLFCFPAKYIHKKVEIVHNCTKTCFEEEFVVRQTQQKKICTWKKKQLNHIGNSWVLNTVHD